MWMRDESIFISLLKEQSDYCRARRARLAMKWKKKVDVSSIVHRRIKRWTSLTFSIAVYAAFVATQSTEITSPGRMRRCRAHFRETTTKKKEGRDRELNLRRGRQRAFMFSSRINSTMENINQPFAPNNGCLRYAREWKNRRGEAQLISIIRGDSRARLQVEANRGEASHLRSRQSQWSRTDEH